MTAAYQPTSLSPKDRVKQRVRHSVDEGNRRRLVIRRKGATLLETPLTIAVIAVIVAPVLAAAAAVAVTFFDTTIEVRAVDPSEDGIDSGSTSF